MGVRAVSIEIIDTPDATITVEIRSSGDGKGTVRTVTATPKPGSPSEVDATLRARTEQSIDGLRLIKNSAGALTAAQLSNAVRLLATVLLAILRLQLARFDDTDG